MQSGALDLQHVSTFRVQQRFSAMVNRYDCFALLPDGSTGPQVAFAQQKRMALREQVTLYTDDSKRSVLCSFKARQMMDVRAQYDVTDPSGTVLGSFRKDFARSLVRSTYHLEQVGSPAVVGQERNIAVAVLRRLTDSIPLAVHLDFATADGSPVMSSERQWGLRDAYRVSVPAPWLDRRLALAVAVGLDALMSR